MIKFIICDDNKEALEIANRSVTRAMMDYDIEYKVLKFRDYLNGTIKDCITNEIYNYWKNSKYPWN